MAIALSVVALLMGGVTSIAQAHHWKASHAAVVKSCPGHVRGVYYYRTAARSWESKMNLKVSKSDFNASKIHSCAYTVWVAHKWAKLAVKLRKAYPKWLAAQTPAVDYDTWDCIHRHEGAWNANTGNGYYGGLQMDMGFQSTYGPEFMKRWGTANKWPAWAQIIAAERARDGYAGFHARGYGPWPNTARACGLL
jgi:hypothetical protein